MRALSIGLVAALACTHSKPNAGGEPIAASLDGGLELSGQAMGIGPGPGDAGSAAADGGSADAGTADAGAADAGSADAGSPAAPKAALEGVTLPPAPPLPKSPAFLGEVNAPADNPLTAEKVALGYQLFFDKRLSKSGTMSCESCHHIQNAFTSGEALDKKDDGKLNKRNAPGMLNIGYHQSFYWDGRKPTVEAVVEAAWTGQLAASKQDVADKLNSIAAYRAAFQRAYKDDATPANVPQALASFLRALKTGDAPWDRFEGGDKKAVSKEVQHGHDVFEKARCTLCHVPPLYTDSQFHNAGIGYTAAADGTGAFADHGRMDASKEPADDGKFKTQPLREIARTGPYFHDGSAKTLEEAVDTMLAGGKPNPKLDEKLKPNKLSAKDRKALLAFLGALSGKATFDSAPELP